MHLRSKDTVKGRFRKLPRGFTLIELLVVLLILSLLLAVVIPTVTQQSDAADATRVASDLTGLRDGISLFSTNVREFPGDVEDLVNLIATTGDADIFGSTYSTAERNRWKGPYVELTVPSTTAATGTAFFTALDGAVINGLVCFNAEADSLAIATANCADSVAAGKTIFATVRLAGIGDTADFLRVNGLIDGSSEANPRNRGRLRHFKDTIYYLAVPIPR